MMTDVPHFSLPFRFIGSPPKAAETEQDSVDEIADCATAIILTRPGERLENPAFGLPDPTFDHLDPDDLMAAIERWEPRAQMAAAEGWDFDSFTQNIRLRMGEVTGG